MGMVKPDLEMLSVALMKSLHMFTPSNWIRILLAASLLLTAVVAGLLVAVPQVSQAQGAPPAKPTGVTASAGSAQPTLTWDDLSDSTIAGYEYLKAPVANLTASDGAAYDNFGFSVAVDGDTVVAGATGDDDNGANSGSAYLFTKPNGGWPDGCGRRISTTVRSLRNTTGCMTWG
jgi:hypothetical protein